MLCLPHQNYLQQNQKIFINVASYRDEECATTIDEAFFYASKKENIFIGICEQNAEESESCIHANTLNKYPAQIRQIHIPSIDAKGPTYGRYLASLLYQGEDYILQIDSHLRFVQDWDIKLLDMMNRCPNSEKKMYI